VTFQKARRILNLQKLFIFAKVEDGETNHKVIVKWLQDGIVTEKEFASLKIQGKELKENEISNDQSQVDQMANQCGCYRNKFHYVQKTPIICEEIKISSETLVKSNKIRCGKIFSKQV